MAKSIANTATGIRKGNTKVWDDNGHFSVQLYSTVVYDETRETITLNNGGWATPTTTSRIRQALAHRGHEISVFIKGGVMYWRSPAGNAQPFVDGKAVITKSL